MKTIITALILSSTLILSLEAKDILRAKVAVRVDGKPHTSTQAVRVESGKQHSMSSGREIDLGGDMVRPRVTLALTPVFEDGMVTFSGVATLRDLLGRSSQDNVHVAGLKAQEFHFSGKTPVNAPITVSFEGSDGALCDVELSFSNLETP